MDGMNLETLRRLKKYAGYTNAMIAEKSGVPLSTVQKVFSGNTESPRYNTLQALYHAFEDEGAASMVAEDNPYYSSGSTATAQHVPSLSSADTDQYRLAPGSAEAAARILSARGRTGKTLTDYMALPEGTRIELIDGVFYDMAGPTVIHQRIAGLILYAFESFINKNGSDCIPSIAPTDVRLDCDDKTMVQPDVLVVCDRNKITRQRIEGAPDLIVEVLSTSHWYHDMIRKKEKYENAGVREYWIVVPEQQAVLVYRFEKTKDMEQYSFEDEVPVGIWDGKCKVDFKRILEGIQFLL